MRSKFRWGMPFILVLLILAAAVPALFLTGCSSKKGGAAQPDTGMADSVSGQGNAAAVDLAESPLTGEMVPRESLGRRPLAVMIENSPAARPQTGLDKADLVYEMLAEGAITRFMVVFMHSEAGVLGPVRSARPYFITRALDYNAIYVYCGGSEAAKQMVRTEHIAALDEFGIGRQAFWRSKYRKAPHNLYTDTEKLRLAAAKKGYEDSPEITPFVFLAEGEKSDGGFESAGPTINYPKAFSKAAFKYEPATNLYLRFTGGLPHLDGASGKQLTVRNIIVQYVNTKTIDDVGRLSMKMSGAGRALLFSGGRVYEGRWDKSDLRARTVFTDENGDEFKLNPGRTWISVVPLATKVEY